MNQSSSNPFVNTSSPTNSYSYGLKGKFTPEQTKERLKIHAISIATGFPTYKQIILGWKERFDIDITEQAEKEWRKANRTKIQAEKQILIDKGEIEIPIISEKVLADNLNVLVTSSCGFNKSLKESAAKKLRELENIKVNVTNLEETKVQILMFNALMTAYEKTTNTIVKSFDKMSELASKAKMVDSKAAFEEEAKLLEPPEEDDNFDPVNFKVSDEDRQKLK